MESFYTYVLGYSCNNNCIFCTRPNDINALNIWGFVEDKNTEQIYSDLKKIKNRYNAIILTGGEPAIREDFLKILKKCIGLGFEKVSIQTNARRFADKGFSREVVKILGSRADFYVSFHSHKKKLFNELTGTESFEESLIGLKNLLSLKAKVRTNTVVMKPNFESLPQTIEFLCGLGVKELELMFVHPNGMAWINRERIIPRIEKTIPFVKKSINIAEDNNASLTLIRFPLCLLGEFKKNASEMFLPKKMILENTKVRTRGKECKKCKYFHNCSGIWAQYLKIYNFEFLPVENQQ